MKSILKYLVLAAFIMLSGASLAGAAGRDTLVFSWSGNAGPLNPHLYSPNQMYGQNMIYESLVKYGADGEIKPWLAKSWEVSPDGKTYTFFLREGVTFSDGTPWNAVAAKKNFDAILANAPRHRWIGLTDQLDYAEAVGEAVLKLHLKGPYYPALYDLATIRPFRFLSPGAFPESGRTAEGIKAPVGTGPWKLADSSRGEFDLFVRNDEYWGQKPLFEKVLVKVITDSEARMIALETGDIDMVFGAAGSAEAQVSLEGFRRLESTGAFESALSHSMTTHSLALNSGQGPTADRAVRRALQHLVDKDLLIKAVFLDMDKRADFLFEPSRPYCDLGLEAYGYDPEKAAAILDEAGWTKGKNSFRSKGEEELSINLCFVGNDSEQKALAEALQGEFRKAGVKLVLIGEEKDSFYRRQTEGDFGMIFNDTFGAPYEPHAMVSSMLVPSHADFQAQSGLPNKKELDEKIRSVLVTTDEDARKSLYKDILTTLHEEAVYLPLTFKTLATIHSKSVAGVDFAPLREAIPFEGMYRND